MMRISFLKVTTGILCAAGIVSPVMAESGYGSSAANSAPPSSFSSSSAAPPSVYSSSSDAPPSTTTGGYQSSVEQQTGSQQSGYSSSTSVPPSTTGRQHKKHDRFSVSLNIPGTNTVISYREPKHGKHHGSQPFWIPLSSDEEIPANAVIGGSQHNPMATFYVCRANYNGGIHPGKYYQGNCNISWGGKEVVMQDFEILVSDKRLAWTRGSNGSIPHHAVPGGSERNRTLYVCQADYANGTHTGKIIGKSCNFGWGGREISVPYYSVLVG